MPLLAAHLSFALAAAPPEVGAAVPRGLAHPEDAAVVVANEDYAFLADVPYASRDADAVAEALRAARGIPADHVQHLRGANREQLLDAVDRAVGTLGPGGTLWVYFAGHGAASPSTTEPLLVGDDAKSDPAVFASRSVALPELEARVGDRPLVLVVDACFAGASRTGEALLPGARFVVPAWSGGGAAGGVVVRAADADQVAGPYEAARHGLFTWSWVGGLRGWADGAGGSERDGRVTVAELDAYVASALRTLQVHGQTPVWRGDRELVLVEGSTLEAAPDLSTLPRPGERPEPTPRPVPFREGPRPPIAHVSGSVWSADGESLTGLEVRAIALQDPQGAAAVRRLKSIPWGQGIAGLVVFEGLALGITGFALSASPSWSEEPGEAAGWRAMGIVGSSIGAAGVGWELWLGGRQRRARDELGAAANRVLGE